MRLEQLAVHFHIGSWGTQVTSSPLFLPISAQQLNFNGYRKILVFSHALWRLPMHHDAAVPDCPARTFICLFSYKSILKSYSIVTELFVVEQMTKPFIELIVSIIPHHNFLVLNPKGIPEILSRWIIGDLGCPIAQIPPVEHGFPIFLC